MPTAPAEPRVRSGVKRVAFVLAVLLVPLISFGEWWWALHHWGSSIFFPMFTAGMQLPLVAHAAVSREAFWAGFGTSITAAIATIALRRRPSLRRWTGSIMLVTSIGGLLIASYGIVMPSVRWEGLIEEIEREAAASPSHRFAGVYPSSFGLTGTYLVLTPERFFVEEWGCRGTYDRVFGHIKVDGVELELIPDPQVAARWHGESMRLIIVHWGERTYAFESWEDFCRAVAWKWEPRDKEEGGEYLRRDDWKKPVDGAPPLPARLSRCYQGPPKSSKVIQVVQADPSQGSRHTTIVLDKGLEDGVLRQSSVIIPGRDDRKPIQTFIQRTHPKTSELELYQPDIELRPGDEVTFGRLPSDSP